LRAAKPPSLPSRQEMGMKNWECRPIPYSPSLGGVAAWRLGGSLSSSYFRFPPDLDEFERARGRGIGRVERLDDDAVERVVEGTAGGAVLEDESLAQAAAGEVARAEVAIRVVAWPAEEGVRRERAAAEARLGEVACPAVAPEILPGAR